MESENNSTLPLNKLGVEKFRMKVAVQNANYLKERAEELIPRGPLVEIIFTGEGPIGIHIVNVGCVRADGTRGPDRVVVASTAEGAQADGRIFFGEQVINVGDVSTLGMKMKEVKLMIADAERPIRIVVQPLAFRTTRHEDFPITPPTPVHYKESPLLWSLASRPHAIIEEGPERSVTPPSYVEYFTLDRTYFFVSAVSPRNQALMTEGDRIIEIDGKRDKALLQGLMEAKYPGSTLILQKVHVSGTTRCSRCKANEWSFSRFCSSCGVPQKIRRS